MRTASVLACSLLTITFGSASWSAATQKLVAKGLNEKAEPGDSDKETNKQRPQVDPELAAFQKQLDELSLPKLKELYASEYNAWVRWRQQNNFGSGCQLRGNFTSSQDKEKELIAKCQAWQQKNNLIARTITSREKGTTDRQANEKDLDAMPIAKLRELYANETQAYDRWRELNHFGDNCALHPRFATGKAKETELVAKCEEWRRKIQMIKASLARREPKAREK